MFGLMLKSTHEAVVRNMLAEEARLIEARNRETRRANEETRRADMLGKAHTQALAERDAARATLAKIAALETPHASHAAKKMAGIARGTPAKANGKSQGAG